MHEWGLSNESEINKWHTFYPNTTYIFNYTRNSVDDMLC